MVNKFDHEVAWRFKILAPGMLLRVVVECVMMPLFAP